MTRVSTVWVGALVLYFASACGAPDSSNDHSPDVTRSATPMRVVTLAPHLAELMFDISAGDMVVGVSAYTDFPEAATEIPIVSDAFVVDHEKLTLLEPDLLLAWESGTPAHVVEELRSAGFRVETIRTQTLADVPAAIRRIGRITGKTGEARSVARSFDERISSLRDENADSEEIRVFYQVSPRPLYTINNRHYISDLLRLCGGINIFADIGDLAPMIDVEAVIARDPEVILAGRDAASSAFDQWDHWPEISANRYGNRFFMPAGEIGRATTRLADAAGSVCDALETARLNRRQYQSAVDAKQNYVEKVN